MKEYRLAVYLGRFQPLHKSHTEVLRKGFDQADKVLIILGSSHASPNTKNPFSPEQREAMIRAATPDISKDQLIIKSVRDYFYPPKATTLKDIIWVSSVNSIVDSIVDQFDIPESEIGILGNYKDSSSYYLDLFPWDKLFSQTQMMDATDVRKILFNPHCGLNDLKPYLEDSVIDWLSKNFVGSEQHQLLTKEMTAIENYKRSWSTAPYAPTFVTTDAVVVKNGHILLVKRKFAPGEGLLALPGGFLKQNERLEDCAIRELKEETRIAVPAAVLRECIKDSKVFDYPTRSTRGRTITHGFLIDLGPTGHLPKVKGSDDAEHAIWVSISDLDERKMYEDHFHIIKSFITSYS